MCMLKAGSQYDVLVCVAYHNDVLPCVCVETCAADVGIETSSIHAL